MDPSSYGHHHHHHTNHPRYVPFSAPVHPPPPPPTSYQQSPHNHNLHPSRHHIPPSPQPPPPPPHQLPPPRHPPPLPQQQQPYHPLPAPSPPMPRQQQPPPPNHRPYNPPHHHQYSFSPNYNSSPNPSSASHQFHDFPQRRVSELDTLRDYRPDREASYHQFDRRPASPAMDRFRHDLEGSPRFRNLELNQRDREEHGRVHSDRWIDDRSSRDFGNFKMGFESNLSNQGFDHEVSENVRWGSRLRDQMIDNGSNEINERDEMMVYPRKIDYHHDSEADRFSDRGSSGEGSHDFNRTPRKQIQKKSAFLRIQKAKPNHRNREDERSHYSSYYNEGKAGGFRGKDSVLLPDRGVEEKEREGSPVELDVSFKSNSLVAKAIVTPPSSGSPSDSNVMPRNSKIRKVMAFDKDSSNLQPSKANESSAQLDVSTSGVNTASGSEGSRQPEVKLKSAVVGNVQDGATKPGLKRTNASLKKVKLEKSPKVTTKSADSSCVPKDVKISDKKKPEPFEAKGTICRIGDTGDGGAQTCSNSTSASVGGSKVEGMVKSAMSNKTGAGAGKPSSVKATKKKTVVRKVMKKATNSPLNLQTSKSAKKCDKPVKAESSPHCPPATSVADKSVKPLKLDLASAAECTLPGVDSVSCPKESALSENEEVNGASKDMVLKKVGSGCCPKESALSENEEVNGTSKDTVLKEVGSGGDPDSPVASKSKRKRNSSSPPLSSSGYGKTNINQGCPNADDSVLGLHIISNIKEDCTETPNETITSGSLGVEDVNKELYHVRSDINISSAVSDISKSSGQLFSDSTDDKLQLEQEVKESRADVPHTEGTDLLLVNSSEVGPSQAVISCTDVYRDDHPRIDPCSASVESVAPSSPCCQPFKLAAEQLSTEPPVSAVNNHQIDDMDIEEGDRIKLHVDTAEQPKIISSEVTQCTIPSEQKSSSLACGSEVGPSQAVISFTDIYRDKHPRIDPCSASVESVAPSSPCCQPFELGAEQLSTGPPVSAVNNHQIDAMDVEEDDRIKLHVDTAEQQKIISSEVTQCTIPSEHRSSSLDQKSLSTDVEDENRLPMKDCLPFESNSLVFGVDDAMDIEEDDVIKLHVDTAEQPKIIYSEVTRCTIPSEEKSLSLDQRSLSTDVEDENRLPMKDCLPSESNSLIFGVDLNEVSTANSSDEAMLAPDILSDVGSPNNPDNLVISSLTCKQPVCQKSEEKAYGDEKFSDDKPTIEGARNPPALVSYSQHSQTSLKANNVTETNQSVSGKVGMFPSRDSRNTNAANSISGETQGRKNQLSNVVPKSYPTRSSFVSSASKNTSSSSIRKPRTWCRTDNSPVPLSGNKPSLSGNTLQREMPKKAAHLQNTSYIRKGNSLVRKSVSVPALPQGCHSLTSSVYRLNSGVVDEVKKGTGPDNRADADDMRTGGANTSFARPTTPPLSSVTKVPHRTLNSSVEYTSSALTEPSASDCGETATNHASSMEIDNVHNTLETGLRTAETLDRSCSVNNLEDLNGENESNMVSSNTKKVTYVKPKSNQLVATSESDLPSILNADKNQPGSASSDGYYKKRKNQLVRTALESHVKPAIIMSNDKSNSVVQVAAKVISSRTIPKKRSNKVVAKTSKPTKFSLVWTLHNARQSNHDGNSRRPKVFPHLIPWKRMTYRRSFKLSSVSSCNCSSSSIGRKMLLLRKRNTVYTRSSNGFSIRKSKVLSVGGSSLKWSKSIEKHSRKANEEATLAVAEAERKKREQKGTVSGIGKRKYSCHKVVHGTELRPGERIFRIGSVRYKMDSSRRSLQRISDDDLSCSGGGGRLSENSTKKSYVPRRLVIGNEEYVRIGNGNQLIRNPKKRTRVLASEKVRWSLHTARLRLVKKRKYCQFFTRFGKCSKDDGKCPYIHDPSKIAVCTKFLKGLCSNPNCKLTHKVIPERMPDCSYYLQGLCTNENCPYRHVYVNPNASTCEGFLRGYCANGNECRKKHSYVCPDFEATGSCPQGSKCKLHHPKNRSKEKKSKKSMEHKNARGRYFGTDILEPKRIVSERYQALDNDDIFFDGKFSDYISLDVSNEEAGETDQVMSDQTTFSHNDSSDLQLDDLDELIKPIRIMNRCKVTEQSSLASEGLSVKHVSLQ